MLEQADANFVQVSEKTIENWYEVVDDDVLTQDDTYNRVKGKIFLNRGNNRSGILPTYF